MNEQNPHLGRLLDMIDRFPTSAGVYLMKDQRGHVIYVGKAANLKNRVRTYLTGGDGRIHVQYLVAELVDIEFSLAANEREALILEDTLIKKFKPRYNIRLRDDKTYLSIRFDVSKDFPRLELVRRPKADGARYFGPFSSAASVRKTIDFVHRLFPLRTCTDMQLASRTRPCLEFQIKRCLAPCVGYAARDQYHAIVDQVGMVLEGKNQEVATSLRAQMLHAAEALEFETAARLRDRLQALELVTSQQQVVGAFTVERDVIGYYRAGDDIAVVIVPIRHGRMEENRSYLFQGQVGEDSEILSTFLSLFYQEGDFIPREVLLPFECDDRVLLEDLIEERAGRKTQLLVPQRGEKTRLIELAEKTAAAVVTHQLDPEQQREKACQELQRVLKLDKTPLTLECFDISNFQGKKPVASKVRFERARPDKKGYRRFKIKTVEESPNDFAMMREVLTRRIARGVEEGGMPDLLVVDGGKGQLGVAVSVLGELGLPNQPVIGFAKPDGPETRSRAPIKVDKIFIPGRKNPIVLKAHSPALRVLQALRDESHRFAITYHRKLRRQGALRSALDDITGIGKKRRTLLLKHFGSVKRLKLADAETIAEVAGIGMQLATQIVAALGAKEVPTPDMLDV